MLETSSKGTQKQEHSVVRGKVVQFIGRWERRRAERQTQREIQSFSPGVREDYLIALESMRRAA